MTEPDGQVTSYRYDPLGRRVAVLGAGSQTRVQVFGLDPNVVAEVSGDVVSRLTFDLGYDRPLAQRSGSSTVFFGQDALSSVTSVFDSAGQVAGRAGYTAYGQLASQTGTASRYTYTGREWDAESGTYDYRDRQYDPATGRFLTEDPVPAANLYWYADANPITLNDPTGRFSMSEITEVPVWLSGLVGAGTSSVAQIVRCGWDSEDVAQAASIGLITGVFGGWVANKLYGVLGGAGIGSAAQQQFNQSASLFHAGFWGSAVSAILADKISDGFSAPSPDDLVPGIAGTGGRGNLLARRSFELAAARRARRGDRVDGHARGWTGCARRRRSVLVPGPGSRAWTRGQIRDGALVGVAGVTLVVLADSRAFALIWGYTAASLLIAVHYRAMGVAPAANSCHDVGHLAFSLGPLVLWLSDVNAATWVVPAGLAGNLVLVVHRELSGSDGPAPHRASEEHPE